MYEDKNYYELEQIRDFLLKAKSFEIDGIDTLRPLIKSIEDEMERRESITAERLLTAACAINVLVIVVLFVSGCASTIRGVGQAVKGVGQGTGTIVAGVGDYLIEEMEGK